VLRTLHTLFPFTSHGGRVSTFLPTGVLFLLFTLPLIIFCRDHNPAPKGTPVNWSKAVRDVRQTLRDAKQHPGTLRFILASFVYQDAIGTIVGFMTLYAVKAVGFDKGSEITLFLVLTVPSIFGSYIYGHLVDRFGPKRSLMATLVLWIVLLTIMILVPGKQAFWLVGLAIGLNFGGVPTAERPVLLGLVPDVGGTTRLVRTVGEARARDLILTGRMMKARTAEKYGLVHDVVHKPPRDEKSICQAALLIDRGAVDEFARRVQAAGRMFDASYALNYSGPWPPYSFVKLRLQAERTPTAA